MNYINEIDKLITLDQNARTSSDTDENYLFEIDRLNGIKLKELIEKYGFPTISLVGRQGNENAFCLVQYQDRDIEFMEYFLSEALKQNLNEYVLYRLAFLSDRIDVNNEKPQRFGTQCITVDQKITVASLRYSIVLTNSIRKAYGVIPFTIDEYLQSMNGNEDVLDKYLTN